MVVDPEVVVPQLFRLNRKLGQESYDLALIWEVPPQQAASMHGIDLCMQSLGVGPTAARSFQSGYGDEDAATDSGGGAF